MRFEVLVLLLFVGVGCAFGVGERGEEWKEDKGDSAKQQDGDRDYVDGSRDDRDHEGNRSDRYSNGNQDDLYYPCDFEDDMDCVRHYFASTGQCKETHNYANKPIYRDRLVAYLPGFNLTIVFAKSRIKFIRDKISGFYINKKTENLVMAVDFEGINVETRYATFIYQRRGQEPIKRTDFTNGTFPVTLTAVIPLKKELDFKDSRVTAYIAGLPETIQLGPKILNSTDPTVVQVNAAIFANLQMAALEDFLFEAPSLFFGYLQKYICDFGIPIST